MENVKAETFDYYYYMQVDCDLEAQLQVVLADAYADVFWTAFVDVKERGLTAQKMQQQPRRALKRSPPAQRFVGFAD